MAQNLRAQGAEPKGMGGVANLSADLDNTEICSGLASPDQIGKSGLVTAKGGGRPGYKTEVCKLVVCDSAIENAFGRIAHYSFLLNSLRKSGRIDFKSPKCLNLNVRVPACMRSGIRDPAMKPYLVCSSVRVFTLGFNMKTLTLKR